MWRQRASFRIHRSLWLLKGLVVWLSARKDSTKVHMLFGAKGSCESDDSVSGPRAHRSWDFSCNLFPMAETTHISILPFLEAEVEADLNPGQSSEHIEAQGGRELCCVTPLKLNPKLGPPRELCWNAHGIHSFFLWGFHVKFRGCRWPSSYKQLEPIQELAWQTPDGLIWRLQQHIP